MLIIDKYRIRKLDSRNILLEEAYVTSPPKPKKPQVAYKELGFFTTYDGAVTSLANRLIVDRSSESEEGDEVLLTTVRAVRKRLAAIEEKVVDTIKNSIEYINDTKPVKGGDNDEEE